MIQGLELEMRLLAYDDQQRPKTFLGSAPFRITPESQIVSSIAVHTQAKLHVTTLLNQAALKLIHPDQPIKPIGKDLDVAQLQAILNQLAAGLLRKDQVRVADLGDRKIIQIEIKA